MKTRRHFLSQSAAVTSGFYGLSCFLNQTGFSKDKPGKKTKPKADDGFSYGELVPDPYKLLDLPEGFRYRILSKTGDRMGDGFKVPGKPDGMAAFDLGDGKIALIRNHEIGHSGFQTGPFDDNTKLPEGFDSSLIYDGGRHGAQPFVGGTTTLILDAKNGKLLDEYLSLVGTDRNCAGGPTPWGSWITCEEPADLTTQWGDIHGYCFEVPATATPGLVKPVALKAMGRFRHEAIAVDPRTGVVYLTEDRNDGVLYRFIPKENGKLEMGGKLQALKIAGKGKQDTRNWPGGKVTFPVGERVAVEWIDLEDVESPKDDLRIQALKKGAAMFSRGEGMWFGSAEHVGEDSVYFACTDGGREHLGQIFRYFPGEHEGTEREAETPGELELYLEPNDTALLKNADNITIAPSGHLYICEDTSGDNHVRGVTGQGEMFTLAKNRLSKGELTGVCMSPDGSMLFVNIQNPGITFAITGPFV